MKKKILITIGVILLVVLIGVIFINIRFKTASLDTSIVNENNKEAKMIDESKGKILVLYFSGTGNTQKLAKIISDEVGGDFRIIEPKEAYPSDAALYMRTKNEADNDSRPELKDFDVDFDDYDTIFIGYPIWWYKMPMVMYSLFDKYDFTGKTIIPFNTHEGSGNGGTYNQIKQLETGATVLEGLPIRGGDMEKDQTSRVETWLESLGFEKK